MSLLTSILTGGVNNHETTSEEVNAVYTDFVNEGVVGTVGNTSGVSPSTGGFSVNAQGTPDATVAIGAGVAYVTGTPTSQNSQTFRVKNTASANLTISANSSGSTKYDWIYIKLDATNLNAPNTAGDDVATIVASRSSSPTSDDGTPPTYGYPIAVVTVANGFSTITNGNIRDIRAQVILSTGASNPAGGWTATSVPTTITNLGNRSYTVLFPSVDLTSTVSSGMRLKLTRSSTAPTQCADLESSSSQYFSKTSPTGVTFTDDYTVMGWVKLESYTAGGIIARRNADTEGWSLGVNSSGQVVAGSYRIASNNSVTTSRQSLPKGKWVHVAATTNLSGTSVLIYIDGVLVPSATVITGTITAIVQGTTALVVGAEKSAGTNPFDGKIAQAAVFSSVLTEATIRSYMSQTLTGAESTNVSAFSLNNTLNDLNANANNLTAQGSALATNADSPFAGGTGGTTEFGIITAAAFSTDTTLTVQVPEGYAIPTTGGVNAVSYSTQKVPFGFPADRIKWRVESLYTTSMVTGATVGGTTYNPGTASLSVPVGTWSLSYNGSGYISDNAATTGRLISLLSTTAASLTPISANLTSQSFAGATGPTTNDMISSHSAEDGYTTAAATTVYANVYTSASASDAGWLVGLAAIDHTLVITVELALI